MLTLGNVWRTVFQWHGVLCCKGQVPWECRARTACKDNAAFRRRGVTGNGQSAGFFAAVGFWLIHGLEPVHAMGVQPIGPWTRRPRWVGRVCPWICASRCGLCLQPPTRRPVFSSRPGDRRRMCHCGPVAFACCYIRLFDCRCGARACGCGVALRGSGVGPAVPAVERAACLSAHAHVVAGLRCVLCRGAGYLFCARGAARIGCRRNRVLPAGIQLPCASSLCRRCADGRTRT